ncbi:DUF4126 domain-containing protein [Georgenia sp. Z1344]|uniref:DUF4126 domain-containing protein n=1 Tax=Georgenia sp. Z1344 TaxID=3416706 RepID=UPI003CF921B2
MELLAASGLALAAGLNAYIPLVALGVLGRFTDLLTLPDGWAWLESWPALLVLGALLVIEEVADKIPAVDSVNDVLQTVVRPTSGGIAFSAGVGSVTPAIEDPARLAEGGAWVPIAAGVLLALIVHGGKSLSRPLLNVGTAGAAAPVASTAEDATSLALVASAILLPVAVGVLVVVVLVLGVLAVRRYGRRRRARRSADPAGGPEVIDVPSVEVDPR